MRQYEVEYIGEYETRVTCEGYPGLAGAGQNIREAIKNLDELIRALEESPYD